MNSAIEFFGEARRETDRAYLVFDGVNEIWIPKSLVRGMRRIGGGRDAEPIVAGRSARENGIV